MNSEAKPSFVVIPTFNSLEKLVKACGASGIIDHEVLLARAIDALIHKDHVFEELKMLCSNVTDLDDEVCSAPAYVKDAVSFETRKEINESLCSLIENTSFLLKKQNMYDNSFLHYEFARIGDDENIILQRVK